MTAGDVRVFINERGVTVPTGAVALDAVRVLFPEEAVAIASGQRRLTDSRGLPVAADEVVVNGAIYRVVAVRSRLEESDP